MVSESYQKLTASVDALEIAVARAAIAVESSLPAHSPIVQRLQCYENVVKRQKSVLDELLRLCELGRYSEAERLADFIRTASQLIRGDITALLRELANLPQVRARSSKLKMPQ